MGINLILGSNVMSVWLAAVLFVLCAAAPFLARRLKKTARRTLLAASIACALLLLAYMAVTLLFLNSI